MKKQYKIIPKNLDLPDEEVAELADFDEVLRRSQAFATEQQAPETKAEWGRNRWIWGGAAAVSLITGSLIWFFFFDQPSDFQFFRKKEKNNFLVEKKVEDFVELKEEEKVIQIDTLSSTPKAAPAVAPRPAVSPKKELSTATPPLPTPSAKVAAEKPTATAATQRTEAEPLAGWDQLYRYFAQAVHYPDTLRESGLSGTVLVRFQVRKDGKIDKVSIVQSLHPLLDAEALRVIEQMPLWKPATLNNQPFATSLTIPITFQITKKGN